MGLLSIIIAWLLGLSVLNSFAKQLKIGEKIGLSMLLGLAAVTFIMFIFELSGIGITIGTVLIAALIIIAALNYKNIKNFEDTKSEIKGLFPYKIPFSELGLTWFGMLGLIVFILYAITSKNLFWPPVAFDAVAGYDLMAKVIANEGAIVNSLFGADGSAIDGSAHRLIYPPFVSGTYAYAYLWGAESSKIITTLIYLSFLTSFYFFLRRVMVPTAAMLAVFFVVITPELLSHAALALTNLPQTAFAATGIISLVLYFNKEEKYYLYVSAALLAVNVWLRSDGIFFNAAAAAGLLFFSFKNKTWKELIIFGVISFAPFVIWQAFIMINGLKAATPEQSLLIPYLFWDGDRFDKFLTLVGRVLFTPSFFNSTFYGVSIAAFVAALIINIKGIINKDLLYFLITFFLAFFMYTALFYQIDYSWDSMYNVISYSYKRGFFVFIPLMWFYVFANRQVCAWFEKWQNYTAGVKS